MTENRASPPSPEFLKSIYPADLKKLDAAALTVPRRHKELRALSLWLVEYDGHSTTKQSDVAEKEQRIASIAATFFVQTSEQVQALAEDYEERVFIEEG